MQFDGPLEDYPGTDSGSSGGAPPPPPPPGTGPGAGGTIPTGGCNPNVIYKVGHPCNDELGRNTPTTGGGGGGGGGGNGPKPPKPPGGAKPVTPTTATPVTPQGDPNSLIFDEIKKLLSGEFQPYDDKSIEIMKGDLHSSIKDREGAERQALEEELARAGLGHSGIRAKQLGSLRERGLQEYGAGVRNIHLERQRMQVQLKLQALDKAQRWLDSLRGYNVDLKKIDLGYAQIAAQKEMLKMQLDKIGKGGGGGMDPLLTFLNM